MQFLHSWAVSQSTDRHDPEDTVGCNNRRVSYKPFNFSGTKDARFLISLKDASGKMQSLGSMTKASMSSPVAP